MRWKQLQNNRLLTVLRLESLEWQTNGVVVEEPFVRLRPSKCHYLLEFPIFPRQIAMLCGFAFIWSGSKTEIKEKEKSSFSPVVSPDMTHMINETFARDVPKPP